jgi:predicted DNA-binding transcriptional regulator AlpA
MTKSTAPAQRKSKAMTSRQVGTEQDTMRLLTKGELASYLTISAKTVDRMRKRGLPSILVSGIRRFDRVEVMAWLRSREKHG